MKARSVAHANLQRPVELSARERLERAHVISAEQQRERERLYGSGPVSSAGTSSSSMAMCLPLIKKVERPEMVTIRGLDRRSERTLQHGANDG